MKNMNNPLILINHIEQQLRPVSADHVLRNQYAWWTLEHITGYNKATLMLQKKIALSQEQQNTLHEWVHALVVQKKPIQYLLGSVPFNSVTIRVRPPILIPRPETEEWCSALATQLAPLNNHKLTILDLCCGSGCIAVTLAKALPQATVYALDIDNQSIALTRENADYNSVGNIVPLQSDLFASLPPHTVFDLIVSNPPYIAPDEWSEVDDSVKKWEAEHALLAQDHGLAVIKNIIAHAPEYLRDNEFLQRLGIPQLIIEIGYTQGKMVTNLFKNAGYTHITLHKDMQGQDRVISGSIPHVAITKNG